MIGSNYTVRHANKQNQYQTEIINNIKYQMEVILEQKQGAYEELLIDRNIDLNLFQHSTVLNFSKMHESIVALRESIIRYCVDGIDSIYLYQFTNDYIISSSSELGSGFRDTMRDTEWIDAYEAIYSEEIGQKKRKDISLIRKVENAKNSKEYLTMISLISGDEKNGVLIAYNIDMNEFRSNINETVREIYLLDAGSVVVFAYEESVLGHNAEELVEYGVIPEELMYVSNSEGASATSQSIMANDMFYMADKLYDEKYEVIVGVDASQLLSEQSRTMILFLLIFLFSTLCSLGIAFLLVMQLYGNLLELVMTVENRIQDKNSFGKLKEISFIRDKMLSVLDKNARIEDELAKRVELISKFKISALQSQINPHYIYNTLNLISLISIRESKQDTDTSEAILALAETVRYAMDQSSYSVSLSDEISHVEKYLFIQGLRYKDRLIVGFDIPTEVRNKKILKITLQPLVENALVHGLRQKSGQWYIKVDACLDEDMLKIKVCDNGVGIQESAQDALLGEGSVELFEQTHAHGLLNLNQRCKIFYGEQYGCEICHENGWTTVVVKYPIIQ